MCRAIILSLAAFALAASAAAEGHDEADRVHPLHVRVAPLVEPVVPLSGNGFTNVTVEAPCAAFGENATGALVTLALPATPDFATATLSPASLLLRPCERSDGVSSASARLAVGFTAGAPAFEVVRFPVVASADGFENATEDAVTLPGFYGILEATVEAPTRVAAPGSVETFEIVVRNLGNGVQRVTASLAQATGGLQVEVPAPVTVPSRLEGDANVTKLVVKVLTPEGATRNSPGLVVLDVRGVFAPDPDIAGGSTQVSILVTTKGNVAGDNVAVLAGALSLLGGVAFARARRRAR